MLRDPIACKPAVMAETDQYVAFGTEYRALDALPGIENANVFEPESRHRLFLGPRGMNIQSQTGAHQGADRVRQDEG